MAPRVWLGAAAAIIVASSCARILDVVQPGEVRRRKTFEALVIVAVDAYAIKGGGTPAFGLVAVSLPYGWDVEEVRYRGPAAGKMCRREELSAAALPTRAGYRWVVFASADEKGPSDYAGARFEVKAKIKVGDEQGDYRLGYAVGSAARHAGVPDVVWDGGVVERWVTVE